MAMTIKIDDVECRIEKFTLGESWLLEREYGMKDQDPENPKLGVGGLLGLLAIATKRTNPNLTEAQVKKKVEELDEERIEIEEDPTSAATSASSPPARRKASAQAKTPAEPGPQP